MTEQRRAEIQKRWEAIDRELAKLWDGRVVDGDVAEREGGSGSV